MPTIKKVHQADTHQAEMAWKHDLFGHKTPPDPSSKNSTKKAASLARSAWFAEEWIALDEMLYEQNEQDRKDGVPYLKKHLADTPSPSPASQPTWKHDLFNHRGPLPPATRVHYVPFEDVFPAFEFNTLYQGDTELIYTPFYIEFPARQQHVQVHARGVLHATCNCYWDTRSPETLEYIGGGTLDGIHRIIHLTVTIGRDPWPMVEDTCSKCKETFGRACDTRCDPLSPSPSPSPPPSPPQESKRTTGLVISDDLDAW